MCYAFAISSTLICLTEYTRSRTLLHISSSMASDGRPDLVSSSKDVLLPLSTRFIHVGQGNVTVAFSVFSHIYYTGNETVLEPPFVVRWRI